ncbi:Cerato-platanin [Pleurostoma richardsiae]|uniref:Cerato-platanin n=1 Tax=Pleurostoma richardsiae TaxID=41990 RepID=A0AA38RCN3_9PEZI|nr:Cerato-platanin [Pleurostoma richardsiae]
MLASVIPSLSLAALVAGATVSVTPHEQYSSSVGVLGCKINTNRVAYWPMAVDCNSLCIKLTYEDRSLNLLRIDQSGGAYDISYDAWNQLVFGQPATVEPHTGGGYPMTYETVDMSQCAGLLYTGGAELPLSAANSMNYVSSCLSQTSSWVTSNYVLYNIFTPTCTYGIDETCTLDMAVSNQPTCPHQLGLTTPLTTDPVYNVQYGTGQLVLAQ